MSGRTPVLLLGLGLLVILTALDFVYVDKAFSGFNVLIEEDFSTAESVAVWAFLPILGVWALFGVAAVWLAGRWALRRLRGAR